jgi:hypothetical protein
MKSFEANFLQCAVRPRTRLPSPERTEAVAARGAVQQHTLTSTTRAEKVVVLLALLLFLCVCAASGGLLRFFRVRRLIFSLETGFLS